MRRYTVNLKDGATPTGAQGLRDATDASRALQMSTAFLKYLDTNTQTGSEDEIAIALLACDLAASTLRNALGQADRGAQRRVFARRDALRDIVRGAIDFNSAARSEAGDDRRPDGDPGSAGGAR